MEVRLTKKKLGDLRFRKNEEAIFKAFFDEENGEDCSVSQLVQKIGIDRATFYRHHKTINEIAKDYERYILEEYSELMNEMRNRDRINLRRMYYEMLRFILQNRRVFGVFIKRKDLKIIKEMILILRSEILMVSEISESTERILKIHAWGIVGLVEDWGIDGFKKREMVKVLNNMMYLTEMAREKF